MRTNVKNVNKRRQERLVVGATETLELLSPPNWHSGLEAAKRENDKLDDIFFQAVSNNALLTRVYPVEDDFTIV